MASVLNNALLIQKAEDGVDCFSRADNINTVRRACIYGKRFGAPKLPIVIQCGCVIRTRVPPEYIRQTEILRELYILKARLHYSDMRNIISLHIEAGKLNSVLVGADIFKYTRRDSLRRFSEVVAGEHPVNIGIVG